MGTTQKTNTQAFTAVISGLIVYLLMLRFHSIPADVQAAIPSVVAVTVGYLAGIIKKELPSASVIENNLANIDGDVQLAIQVLSQLDTKVGEVDEKVTRVGTRTLDIQSKLAK